MASADRATPVRQSRTVPNISKKSALTPYCELPGTPWPRDGPAGRIAELVTMPPAVIRAALFRDDRLPSVAISLPPRRKNLWEVSDSSCASPGTTLAARDCEYAGMKARRPHDRCC